MNHWEQNLQKLRKSLNERWQGYSSLLRIRVLEVQEDSQSQDELPATSHELSGSGGLQYAFVSYNARL